MIQKSFHDTHTHRQNKKRNWRSVPGLPYFHWEHVIKVRETK